MHEEHKIEDIEDQKSSTRDITEEELVDLEFKYKHRKNITLDIWIPTVKLAVEYQGEQHYKDIYLFGERNIFIARDIQKKIECKRRGITIVEIPYWWDRSPTSLVATIIHARPDLLPYVSSEYLKQGLSSSDTIPMNPPNTVSSSFFEKNSQWKQVKSSKILQKIVQNIPTLSLSSSSLAISKLFSIPEDYVIVKSIEETQSNKESSVPVGWWMSPKYPGIRVLWDGVNKFLYSRNGKPLSVPQLFISHLEDIRSNSLTPLYLDGYLV